MNLSTNIIKTHKTVPTKINQIRRGVLTNRHVKLASFFLSFVFEQYNNNIQLFNKNIQTIIPKRYIGLIR